MWSTPHLPLLSDPLLLRVVVPARVPSMGQIELINYLLKIIIISWNNAAVQIIYIRLEYLINRITNAK